MSMSIIIIIIIIITGPDSGSYIIIYLQAFDQKIS